MSIDLETKTNSKFESLQFIPGDMFSEMLSHWKVIIKSEGSLITTLEGNSFGLQLNTYNSPEEFKMSCAYNSIPGYWVSYHGNNTDRVGDYIDHYCKQKEMSLSEIRDFKIDLVF